MEKKQDQEIKQDGAETQEEQPQHPQPGAKPGRARAADLF